VQESLTNVLKHAGTVRTDVAVRYEPSAVSVEIVNEAPRNRSAAPSRTGHGLIGMRERVTAWGGTLHAGPRPGGGFRIAARLPYGST
jgi:signal transduction histidine kinase